ncbi:Putative pre-16S rRNA nuclease [Thalassocella blandensis]|nr:Putative pre-16S rRNA nuclease [Thalassocella blandensis]
MSATHQRLLAFDFGTKSIGVAVGLWPTQTITELHAIKAKDGIPNWDEINALLSEWQVDSVIVGLPVKMDGSDMEITRRARKFGNRLHGRFGCPVLFFDETLSTREAKEEAFARGHRGNFGEAPIDSIAAGIILQSWFNSQA